MPHAILFVDDEPEVLALLRRTFPAADGYEALTAGGAEDALRILSARDVDLLVTDQRMPGLSGIELVERARRLRPGLCAILLTAYTDPRDIVDAINRCEIYRYLVKPWETADLRQTIVRALEQVHLRRERERLLAEAERRLAALEAASEITRELGAAEGLAPLLERVVERLPRVVHCDVAAALLGNRGRPVLIIRPVARLADAALLRVKLDALQAYVEHTGGRVNEARLEVRVTAQGEGRETDAFHSRLTLPVIVDDVPAGVVLVESQAYEAFTEGDARVLDVLVNEVADALGALASRFAAERSRLERIVECMADGLVYAASGSSEVTANPAARRLLGAPLTGPIDQAWLEDVLGFSPFDVASAHGASRGGPHLTEVAIGDRVLSATVSPVADRGGGLAGVAVALREVTDPKRLDGRK